MQTPGKLVLTLPNGQAQEFELAAAGATLGRATTNEIVLRDPKISRRQARLEWAADRLQLIDLGSANGTRLNDVKIEPHVPQPLKDGDIIGIGGFTLTLHLSHVKRPDTPVPAILEETFVPQESPTLASRIVVKTPAGVKEFPLDRATLTLGRETGNDIVIDDRAVSRRHAQLQRVDQNYEITDLGSANGLTFQGARVPKQLLVDGDVIWITKAVSLTYQSALPPVRAKAPLAVETVSLGARAEVTIGRDAQNDVTLSHPSISRLHARIVRRNGEYVIQDAGSKNGTFVNGVSIAPDHARVLRPGDTIRVGPIKFVFAPDTLEKVDESHNLRLDALHLNQFVSKRINLLQDISLAIKPCEFVVIAGVSGAGKSTLLNALTGFHPASAGTVLVNGTDLYHNFDAFRTSIGYVPQENIIHKELTVHDALDYSARLRLPADTLPAERQDRVTEVLDSLNLTERKNVPIQKLSGGQRKRVSIGVELLTQPGLFFLDEATSGLDPGNASQLMRLLRRLADEGQTILLVTHATKNAMLCDQVAFLAGGGYLAYYGPPAAALQYFGVEDFDAIYQKLENEQTPQVWNEQYRNAPQFKEYVVERLQDKYGALIAPVPAALPAKRGPARTGVGGLRQFRVLSARYLNIIRRDWMNLLLLLLIAPILGSIDFIVWPRQLLDPREGDPARGVTFLFLSAIVPFLVGALSSVREIVKETAVYQRERTVALKIAPYLMSKILIGFLFALYHAAMLLAIKTAAVDFSSLSAEELGKFYVTLALAAMSGVLWGLLVSAIAPREEQAMLLVIVVIVAQIFFAGGILPLKQLSDTAQMLGDVTSSKWAFQALTTLVSTVNERYGGVYGGDLYASWSAMALIMVALYVLLFVLQKRKDVI